ncbi:MAG: restriction endonuclease [Candidatus Glassbacteria bacterium]|nr:restriction endonuclease [Candidatus Glassbacteria bacterium]
MDEKRKRIFGFAEKLGLAIVAVLVIIRLFFWDLLRQNPLLSGIIFAVVIIAAVGFWVRRNFKLVGKKSRKSGEVQAKLEGILNTMFRPKGYDIMELPRVDEQRVCWAVIRDSQGIRVVVEYFEISMGELITPEQLQSLVQRMNMDGSPKGVCLTTGFFDQEALDFAREHNILTKDGDQLLEMIHQVEEGYVPGKEYFCRYCGSKLEPNKDITGLLECLNPDCRKTYSTEELEEEQKIALGDLKTFNINCYNCGRPVQIDTTMNGLMECPYDDCSWVINVDNELLALRGGHDRKILERLTEIKCPKCDKMIKVPADAEGLMECPCEEKWIIDVGAALGERAQAQVAESLEGEEEAAEAETPPPRSGERSIQFVAATASERQSYGLRNSGGEKGAAGAEPDSTEAAPQQAAAENAAGETAQPDEARAEEAQAAAGLELYSQEGEVSDSETEDEVMVDCPGCGAGVPARLAECPVCHTTLEQEAVAGASTGGLQPPAAGAASGQVTHRLAYMKMSTGGLLIFFLISISAFLTFVYFITR